MHLERLWKVPMVQRHHGLDACRNERIREVAVEGEPSRVDLQGQSVSTCETYQSGPCTRTSMGLMGGWCSDTVFTVGIAAVLGRGPCRGLHQAGEAALPGMASFLTLPLQACRAALMHGRGYHRSSALGQDPGPGDGVSEVLDASLLHEGNVLNIPAAGQGCLGPPSPELTACSRQATHLW